MMSAKQNLTNRTSMTERCRICLADNGCMISLRNERVESKLKDLVKCTFVDIKHEENLPAFVCHVCLYKLNMWSEFKERFIQSNKILLGQLQVSEVSDIEIKNSSKDGRNIDGSIKRKRLSENNENTVPEQNDKKKSKTEATSSEVTNIECVTNQNTLDTIDVSDNNDKSILPKDSDKTLNASNDNKPKENGDERIESKSSVGLTKNRLLPGKRGRAIERRKASTKRWVARKKALLAATGENVSDTDSIASDDAQMSPVQKARAKTNADKEAERQKRIAKVLKNLEMNLTEKYTLLRDVDHIGIGDTDSDTRKTRLSKELHSKEDKNLLDKQGNVRRTRSSSQEQKENTPMTNDVTETRAKKSESLADDGVFTPRLVKSELMVGNDRYIVTSTLIRTGTSRLSKESLNNVAKDGKNPNADDSSQEKNTDIIDAVQLRRVHPAPSNSKSKKFERCLNVDVETTELESLKRVQVELADFVEYEMKQKLFGTNDAPRKVKRTDNFYGKAYRKLDQQLKGIVGKTIINNVEASFMRDTVAPIKEHHQQSVTVSSEFIEIAKNSPIYQPIVIVERLNIEREIKFRVNNPYALKQGISRNKLFGPFSVMSRKRQSIPPKRYTDFNTSALESDSDEMDEMAKQETPKTTNTLNLRTYGNVAAKQSSGVNNQIPIIKRMDGSVKAADNSVTVSVYNIEQNSTAAANEEKPDYEEAIKIEGAIAENHICGVCGISFDSRKDVEEHVRAHKTSNAENNTITVTRQVQKPKVKRCKRCQTLVDARYVKAHVCKTSTPLSHKCYVCNSTFRTEKLLVRHLDNHDQSEFKLENITKLDNKVTAKSDKEQDPKSDAPAKSQSISTEKNDVQADKTTRTGTKLIDDTQEKPKETYTCFVCDKIFTDEEVLKDHLQKHCDDLSEGEQSNSKEQYQCAICGSTLESDQALEEHVGKHLFDDEDDNPNLISIREEDDQSTSAKMYQCGQCSEIFDSDVLLEMHVQEHEEEIAIAEWEKKGMDTCPYECMLCGEYIDTEEELAEHLDAIHNICNADAHVCQLCDQPFGTLEELQEHVATH